MRSYIGKSPLGLVVGGAQELQLPVDQVYACYACGLSGLGQVPRGFIPCGRRRHSRSLERRRLDSLPSGLPPLSSQRRVPW